MGAVLKCACSGNTGQEGGWGLDQEKSEMLLWDWSPSPHHVSIHCSPVTGHKEGKMGFLGPDALGSPSRKKNTT